MKSKRGINELEKEQAERLDMTRNPLSGGGTHKNDMRNDMALVESKFTSADTQITVKRKDIEDLDINAFDYNPPRIPAMLISINGFERMVISVEDFMYYIRLLRKE